MSTKSHAYQNFIAGKWVDSVTKRRFDNVNPADSNDHVGTFPDSNAEDINAAVAAAKSAFNAWRLTPAPKRGELLYTLARILERDKEEHATVMTREMGKPLAETRGDVQEAIDTAYYCAGEGRRLFGDTVPVEMPNKFGMSIRVPVGICGVITPWNFPMAIATWNLFPALVAGNTCVLKPAEDTPASAIRLAKNFEEAGFPAGTVNVVCGYGPSAGAPLVEHPDVRVISFTGSTQTGRHVAERAGSLLKKLCLEMGGKNAQIVMNDASMDLALEGALWGAFGTTGQRCTATSRLILQAGIHDKFVDALMARATTIKVGNGLDATTQMGPLINAKALEKVEMYVGIGRDFDKAQLRMGGTRLTDGDHARGHYFAPTLFTGVTPKMRIAQEEIFGPVVTVLKVADLDEAIRVLNDTAYGLSSSIYTKDVDAAFRAIRDIEAGITYVNGPTIGAEVQLPFGGVKGTGNGHREAGHAVLDVYTEWKSVYVDYSGKLQRAQID